MGSGSCGSWPPMSGPKRMPEARGSRQSCPRTGERFEGLLPPVVMAPAFAIRKPAVAVFTLDDYVASGIMTAAQAGTLRTAVTERWNVLVAGGTSTGKTTLVNALLREVEATGDRVVLIEDTRELQCAAPNLVAMRTKDGVASLTDLVRSSLRLRRAACDRDRDRHACCRGRHRPAALDCGSRDLDYWTRCGRVADPDRTAIHRRIRAAPAPARACTRRVNRRPDMLDLREYRTRRVLLADYLPWAGLVAPGIVLNKDGSLQRTCRFRGPDLDSATDAELVAVCARLNNALKRLGSGWALFVEALRHEAAGYPESRFPDPVSFLVDRERRAMFETEGAHFESQCFLTFVYLAPPESAERVQGLLYDSAGEKRGIDWREQLEAFQVETDRVTGLLEGLMPEIAWLDDAG